jgi:outer membrane protein TolC
MNIEKIELQCAETLLAYAETMAEAYTNQPEDSQATLTALIGRTLELHLNRKINLENLYK